MSAEANGKNKTMMNGYPRSWSRMNPPGNAEKNWSKLIQKIYEADPLTCRKCSGKMKIISLIENGNVIKKILKHLGLWDIKTRSPPMASAPPGNIQIDHSLRGVGPYGPEADSQLPPCEDYLYRDPDYPIETYVS